MPSLPVPEQTDAVIQNQATGVVDYLKYEGNTIVSSDTVNYGLGPTWKIVADGNFLSGTSEDLVAQSTLTGQLDFLGLNAAGQLVTSSMTSQSFAPVHGEGYFSGGMSGPALISQLPNGQLDFLGFNSSGTFIASDLVANSVGLPTLVGGGTEFGNDAEFNNIDTGGIDGIGSVITQLPNGELDAIGFSRNFPNLSVSGTLLMPQTIGAFPVSAVDPDFSGPGQTTSEDVPGSGGTYGVQLLTQSGSNVDMLYLDSGYGTSSATEGSLYASSMLSPLPTGWNLVDGGFVAQEIFPVS